MWRGWSRSCPALSLFAWVFALPGAGVDICPASGPPRYGTNVAVHVISGESTADLDGTCCRLCSNTLECEFWVRESDSGPSGGTVTCWLRKDAKDSITNVSLRGGFPQQYLVSNIKVLPEEPPTHSDIEAAEIVSIYALNTADFTSALLRVTEQLAYALGNFTSEYLALTKWESLSIGTCTPYEALLCGPATSSGELLPAPGVGGTATIGSGANQQVWNLDAADPKECLARSDSTAASSAAGEVGAFWLPSWNTEAELEQLAQDVQCCANTENSSLMFFSPVTGRAGWVPSAYITGERDMYNTKVYTDGPRNLTLWIMGRTPINWAKLLNKKLSLERYIPLPELLPGVLNTSETMTDLLELNVRVFGMQISTSLVSHVPVCTEPDIPKVGCFRIDHLVYRHPNMSDYKLDKYIRERRHLFTQTASDALGEFNITEGPWPHYAWLLPKETPDGPWEYRFYPQNESHFEETCVKGATCSDIPLAPLPRYLHSTVVYRTWSWVDHAHRRLCAPATVGTCGEDCLTNLTCLGGPEAYFNKFFHFRTQLFPDDDFGFTPRLGMSHKDCPGSSPADCCLGRRICYRTHDVLGYEVPFDSPMLLVFGGRSFNVSQKYWDDDGSFEYIYHKCHELKNEELLEEWRMCAEMVTNDLWRYDILGRSWQYLKPGSAISSVTGEEVGHPKARYGHGAVLIQLQVGKEIWDILLYMYIYGGLGIYCDAGVCNDVWRYEVPWAAQAYYPLLAEETVWNRGNLWNRLGDCPFGGRYRHGMVALSNNEDIFIYGGQGLGHFKDELLNYKVSTDSWEAIDAVGVVSLTRLRYDNLGFAKQVQVAANVYDESIDVDCQTTNYDPLSAAYAHCQACPECGRLLDHKVSGGHLPTDRGDFGMAVYFDNASDPPEESVAILGGHRTLWGSYYGNTEVCDTTTTTIMQFTTTTTTSLDHFAAGGTGGNTGNVGVIGTFKMTDGYPTTTTTTTTVSKLTTITTTTIHVVNPYAAITTSTSTSTVTTQQEDTTTTTTQATTTSSAIQTTTTTASFTVVQGLYQETYNLTNASAFADSSDVGFRVGPGSCLNQYYFNDLWTFHPAMTLWREQIRPGDVPTPRRGHQFIARRSLTNDTQLVLFGGHNQDTAKNDMWVLNIMRLDMGWSQIDPFVVGGMPPPMSFHSMSYVEELNMIIVFGGLHWSETNATQTDEERNIDRRCFKLAQALPENFAGRTEVEFLTYMVHKCNTAQFCCTLPSDTEQLATGINMWEHVTRYNYTLGNYSLRTSSGAINLTEVSILCRASCKAGRFEAKFASVMNEGVWIFHTLSCPGNCNGHGYCDMSKCTCEPGWYGTDCSVPRCPGSTCYTHVETKEQFCIECSHNGVCIDGECHCNAGWGFADCSAHNCDDNCSSTAAEIHGVCVEDFPVHQCHCFHPYSGRTCDVKLCLNECSGHGDCVAGVCQCEQSFHGEDCSVFMVSL